MRRRGAGGTRRRDRRGNGGRSGPAVRRCMGHRDDSYHCQRECANYYTAGNNSDRGSSPRRTLESEERWVGGHRPPRTSEMAPVSEWPATSPLLVSYASPTSGLLHVESAPESWLPNWRSCGPTFRLRHSLSGSVRLPQCARTSQLCGGGSKIREHAPRLRAERLPTPCLRVSQLSPIAGRECHGGRGSRDPRDVCAE